MAEPFDLKSIEKRMEGALASLKTEFTGLRTGRASVHLLDTIQVSAYGSMMPLNQVASVSAPEARMLAVNVWDKSHQLRLRANKLGMQLVAAEQPA